MTTDLTIGEDSTRCPACWNLPINGEISHKHDCPFHQRRVNAALEKERKKRDRAYARERRMREFYYWRSRSGEIMLILFFIAVVIALMWFGFEALEETR